MVYKILVNNSINLLNLYLRRMILKVATGGKFITETAIKHTSEAQCLDTHIMKAPEILGGWGG